MIEIVKDTFALLGAAVVVFLAVAYWLPKKG